MISVLKQWCLDRRVPCISSNTETFFRNFLHERKPKRVCEIGSAVGYSGIVFASIMQARHGQIWSIEHSFPDYRLACFHAGQYNLHNITFYHADAARIDYQKVCGNQKMDLIYIDARKSDYFLYFQRVVPIIAPHTTVIFDDVIKYAHKTQSLYEYLEKKQIEYTIHQLDDDDGIMVIENAGKQLTDYSKAL